MDIVLQIFFDGLGGVFAEDSALEVVLRPDKANGKMMAMSSGIFQWSASNNPAAVPLSLLHYAVPAPF
jgi:hypothetical protein